MRRLAVAVVSLAGLVSGCGGTDSGSDEGTPPVPCSAASATATTSVSIAGQFLPFCVRISPGATVTFTNIDYADHAVSADAGQPEAFESPLLQPGLQFTHTFAERTETVRVYCRIHPEMGAVIVVQ